jgi:hypothetical protein
MAVIELSQLSAELREALRGELHIGDEDIATVEWFEPRRPAILLFEVWPRFPNPQDPRPDHRYMENKARWWKDAVAQAALMAMDNITVTVVPAEEAEARLLEMEMTRPSVEFLRIGRIWNLRREPSRAARVPEAHLFVSLPVAA